MALPGGGTNCAYWERVAADYDCEIMDTLSEDKGKVLRKRLRDCCRKLRKTKGGILALDAGCGAGKWLPFLGSLVDDPLACGGEKPDLAFPRRRGLHRVEEGVQLGGAELLRHHRAVQLRPALPCRRQERGLDRLL